MVTYVYRIIEAVEEWTRRSWAAATAECRWEAIRAVYKGQDSTCPTPTNPVMLVTTDEALTDETISSPTRTEASKYVHDSVHRVKCTAPRGNRTPFPILPHISRILSKSGNINWRKLASCSSQ